MTPNDRFATKTLRLDAVFKWIGRLFMRNIASAHVSQHRKVLRNLSKIISLPKKSGIPKLAFLIGTLALVPALSVASPATSNEASIDILSTITSATVTVNEGGSGCSSGRQWDVGVGRCTSPILLSSSSTSQTQSGSCPSGQLGSVTLRRTCTTRNYGWRVPPSGGTVPSPTNPTTTSCTAWTTSSSCYTPTPPPSPPPPAPSGPAVGTAFTITALICDYNDPGYYYGPGGASMYWFEIIKAYRNINSAGRCPEAGGYRYWIDVLGMYGFNAAGWANTRLALTTAAISNGENGPNGIASANLHCQQRANALFGAGKVVATYKMNSGNECRVTSVN